MSQRSLPPGTVLLTDVLAQEGALLLEAPVDIVTCTSLDDVPSSLARLEAAQANGRFAAGFLAYELGFAFEEKLRWRFQENGEPLLWFGLYERAQALSLNEAKLLLENAAEACGALVTPPAFDMDRSAYGRAFASVRDHLARGDAYQVNLTMRAHFGYQGAPERLFLDLLKRQPVEFAAFLRLEDRTVLSLSPELFLEREGDLLRTRPMKGTAPRGRTGAEDTRIARDLAADPKQRAENTMIVDLMRNDLSRIADTGSVKVTALCEAERYRSLHQMTSTIEARVPSATGFAAIVERLFPCGSITGAPKLRAMEIAHDLENGPRGVYTGSIGYLAPGGDFRLNVAIRTLVLRDGGSGEAGAGSGVVFDSGAAPEYDECLLKLKFMSGETPGFDLIETMAYDPATGFLLMERHLHRLQKSARYFGFSCDDAAIRAALSAFAGDCRTPQRVRLLLSEDGEVQLTSTALSPPAEGDPFLLTIAKESTRSEDCFLYHKTTNRAFYDGTRQRYQAETGCQEVLFENERGYLTEGSYTTLFVCKDGRLLTPALHHGLLPGTFREALLERGLACEADLTRKDLETAEAIYAGNSVRGLMRAALLQAAGADDGDLLAENLARSAVGTGC